MHYNHKCHYTTLTRHYTNQSSLNPAHKMFFAMQILTYGNCMQHAPEGKKLTSLRISAHMSRIYHSIVQKKIQLKYTEIVTKFPFYLLIP